MVYHQSLLDRENGNLKLHCEGRISVRVKKEEPFIVLLNNNNIKLKSDTCMYTCIAQESH